VPRDGCEVRVESVRTEGGRGGGGRGRGRWETGTSGDGEGECGGGETGEEGGGAWCHRGSAAAGKEDAKSLHHGSRSSRSPDLPEVCVKEK
jgi:hypothetical protein